MPSGTALVAAAIEFLALGLVFYALVEVATRIFYAMKDTVTPVVAGRFDHRHQHGDRIRIARFTRPCRTRDWPHASTGIEALILMAVSPQAARRVGRISAAWLAKLLLATAVMALMAELVTAA